MKTFGPTHKFGKILVAALLSGWMVSDAYSAERMNSPKRRSSNENSNENRTLAQADKEKTANPANDSGAEAFDVDNIKKKYWARGDESQLGVVQNRLYKKANRWSLGFFVGAQFADPFLLVTPIGMTAGYHFSETFGLNLLFFRPIVSESSAFKRFVEEKDGLINTNEQIFSLGVEGNWSLLYGKLSLVGRKIIYYDMHLSTGGGVVETESGRYAFLTGGLGQRFFLNKNLSMRLDYRLQFYRERFFEKTIDNQIGNLLGSRNVMGHTVTLGFDIMFGDGQ